MPAFTRTAADTVELPDLGLTVAHGDTVELPEGMYDDFAAAGFEPAASAPEPQSEPAPDAAPAADATQE